MIRIFTMSTYNVGPCMSMCVIEGIESVIDESGLFLTRIYGLFILKHV